MDIFSKNARSQIMAKVRSFDTDIEVLVRKCLFANGFRYRKNDKRLPGKPDIVLPKYKTIIFVHGCFWHGHANCDAGILPKSRQDYWSKKIGTNINRDKNNISKLEEAGWAVLVIWECNLKGNKLSNSLNDLLEVLGSKG